VKLDIEIDGVVHQVAIEAPDGSGTAPVNGPALWRIQIDGEPVDTDACFLRPGVLSLLIGGRSYCIVLDNDLGAPVLTDPIMHIGAERIATGHYAINEYDEGRGRWILKRPTDRAKDQTYFLFGLTQAQLSRTLFPLGHLTKPEVREVARSRGLALAELVAVEDQDLRPRADQFPRDGEPREARAADQHVAVALLKRGALRSPLRRSYRHIANHTSAHRVVIAPAAVGYAACKR